MLKQDNHDATKANTKELKDATKAKEAAREKIGKIQAFSKSFL